MKRNIIISEPDRPFWQIPIAAFFFTLAIALVLFTIYTIKFTERQVQLSLENLHLVIILFGVGAGFCFKKYIHIDIGNSKFKPTIGLGLIQFGKWQTIKNYQYVSVFHQPTIGGTYIFEVNLWYDNNKHFELYEEDSYEDAFLIGFELSEELDIDLLDATIPNDFKWVDKAQWRVKIRSGIKD
jgi:hypothetical protein